MDKVYIILVHDECIRPYIHSVAASREAAKDICDEVNKELHGHGHADFISEIILGQAI